jgi:predicted nucleic acid-binding protein
MRANEEVATCLLLDRLPMLAVDAAVADRGAAYRRLYWKSHRLLLPDALIAATVSHHGLILATLNIRDFPMTDLQIQRPY